MKGKLIEIIGITNVGKTTQIQLLKEYLINAGYIVQTVKYPVYDLFPTGPRINSFLRGGNPERLTPLEFQNLNVINRRDFESTLKGWLNDGCIVIAEMYIGSSIAYGMGDGISKQQMEEMNDFLCHPDLSILLDGDRFIESKESGHHFEEDDEKTERIRHIHLDLAIYYGWPIVQAGQPREQVLNDILVIVRKLI